MKIKSLQWLIVALMVLCAAYAVVLRKYQQRLDLDERTLRTANIDLLGPGDMRALSSNAFNIGLKLGWSCRNVGGSTEDAEFLIRTFHENNPEAASNWFRMRQDKAPNER